MGAKLSCSQQCNLKPYYYKHWPKGLPINKGARDLETFKKRQKEKTASAIRIRREEEITQEGKMYNSLSFSLGKGEFPSVIQNNIALQVFDKKFKVVGGSCGPAEEQQGL